MLLSGLEYMNSSLMYEREKAIIIDISLKFFFYKLVLSQNAFEFLLIFIPSFSPATVTGRHKQNDMPLWMVVA